MRSMTVESLGVAAALLGKVPTRETIRLILLEELIPINTSHALYALTQDDLYGAREAISLLIAEQESALPTGVLMRGKKSHSESPEWPRGTLLRIRCIGLMTTMNSHLLRMTTR